MSDQVPKIKRVGHIVLHVVDPARSAQWYCDVLGMIKVVELKDGPYKGAVFLSFGVQDHDIGLFPGGHAEAKGREFEHVALEVDCAGDLRKFRLLYDKLLQRGARIAHVLDHGVSKGVYFYDPDGHMLEVYCQLTPYGEAAIAELAENKGMADPIGAETFQ